MSGAWNVDSLKLSNKEWAEVRPAARQTIVTIPGATTDVVAVVFGKDKDAEQERARLIAAAPELLAFAEGLDCECDSYHGHTCKRCIVIAKARGDA